MKQKYFIYKEKDASFQDTLLKLIVVASKMHDRIKFNFSLFIFSLLKWKKVKYNWLTFWFYLNLKVSSLPVPKSKFWYYFEQVR